MWESGKDKQGDSQFTSFFVWPLSSSSLLRSLATHVAL
ncbi:unnamed protein product [Brassica oleracea]